MGNSLNSASTSSGQAKGKNFIEKLLYVQHVDKEKKMTSEISELILLKDLLADRKVDGHDSNLTENVGNSESNLDILKSFLKDKIIQVCVCSNPLPIPIGSSSRVTFHAFVVFLTHSEIKNSENEMYWSLEKNGKYIVLQQSTNQDDVIKKLYDAEKGQIDKRYGRVKIKKFARVIFRSLEDLLRIICEYNQISDPYHLLFSNCQNFASFIFENLNGERKKWSTYLSAAVDLLRVKKKKTAIELNALMYQEMDLKYQSIVNDDKFYCYWAMMEGRRKDFEELTNDLTIEFLNRVDSQGYTLLEWATVFSTSDWPIDEDLKGKGAAIRSDKELFRRNLFFIALQYQKKKSKLLSFDGIDIHGVANKAGDMALHLALNGEKWKIAEKILRQLENYEVNSTNFLGDTPLHLAAKLKNCEFGLFKKILKRTDSGNVNKADGNGWTALHYAIDKESATKVGELLNHKDVDVNIPNMEDNITALHLASKWPNIPADLFQMILEKSTSDTINTQDDHGNIALHLAMFHKSKTVVKELLNHKNVNVPNNQNVIALHLASSWKDFPMDLFKQILEKTTNINAQEQYGNTALHLAIDKKSKTKVKELLEDNRVDVNIKNKGNETALHLASRWTNIPSDLFKLILEKTTDVNAQDEDGKTALHSAILYHDKESGTKVKKLLEDDRVDVNVKTNNNETALHLVSSEWKSFPADLFKIILEKSTDVINAQDRKGCTALHLAIIRQFEIATKELLKHSDVNVNMKNNNNGTALHFASQWNGIPSDLFNLILEKSTDVINSQDRKGCTALHFAILFKSEIATKELLKHNDVNVNVKNNNNETALHLACYWWKDIPSDLFKTIQNKSTDINAQDKDGKTALHYAFCRNDQKRIRVLLEDDRVNVNVKDNHNLTAFDHAFY